AVFNSAPARAVGRSARTAEMQAAAMKNTPGPEWKKGRLNRAALQAASGNNNVTTHEIARARVVGEDCILLFLLLYKFERWRRVAFLSITRSLRLSYRQAG